MSGAVVRLTWPGNLLEACRDFKELGDIVEAIVVLAGSCDYGVLELVSAMQGQGVVSMFSFGRATGVAMGAMFAMGLPFIEIAPNKWQSYWRDYFPDIPAKDEFPSVKIARGLFPSQPELFKRVKDHGTADAALIARYAVSEIILKGGIGTSRQKGIKVVGGPARLNKVV